MLRCIRGRPCRIRSCDYCTFKDLQRQPSSTVHLNTFCPIPWCMPHDGIDDKRRDGRTMSVVVVFARRVIVLVSRAKE